ncbi:Blr0077 protein [Candidatus Vecturithrix granuli]|uniref:Blr0077 protein n=1 Tax=Vecturithrix granuli TaxID=1499967 RepID=A0A081C4V0_VECG1|nr:Blr0077 protein [Candidatus Vecturithrix granuli]
MGKKSRISPPDAELKILFAKSGNVCAFPGCNTAIIAEEGDERRPLAEMAHIIAYEDNGPRADPALSMKDRNKASNFILLCPTHHALVDKFEYQYNVHVLREMKRIHEDEMSTITRNFPDNREQSLKTESLHASILPISRLPRFIFSANTPYRKNNVLELFDILNTSEHKNVIYAFELRDKRLYTFFDLNKPENPFRGAYDQTSVESLKATDLWLKPDTYRLYIALLNRSLTSYLKKLRVAYDAEHHRHYFQSDRNSIERKYTYVSLAGKKTEKAIVHHPITKKTGIPKPYWVHCAANLSFQQVAPRQWVLTMRPERHLTKDGYEPYTHSSIGSKITRIKSTMYNWQYLQELQLWREFITNAKPRCTLRFENQSIVIENQLLEETITWVGVPDDEKDFVAQIHEEDLFTFMENRLIDEVENSTEEELEEELLLDEYEE